MAKYRATSKVRPAAIESMFVRGGQIDKFATKLRRDTVTQSRRAAPRRTGTLRKSIQGDRMGTTGPYHNQFRVYAWARHAQWVNEGTAPIIWPRKGKGMVLYADGRAAPARWAYSELSVMAVVDGQEPNPFLAIGLARAMALHGLF